MAREAAWERICPHQDEGGAGSRQGQTGDPDDPLKLVIVRDMWLTGTDIPPLTYLYVDKPLKGHGLIQAIARANRVFPGKTGGVVVDYIGIADALKEATHKYTQGGGKGKPIGDLSEEAVPIFLEALEAVRKFVPPGVDISNWRAKPKVEREDWLADFVGHLMGPDEDAFLNAQAKLDKAYQLVKHLTNVLPLANEVLLCEIAAVQIKRLKGTVGGGPKPKNLEEELKKLIDRSVGAREEAIDLFEKAGLEKPDISILDEAFLADFREKAPRGSAPQTAAKVAGGGNLLSRTAAASARHRTEQEVAGDDPGLPQPRHYGRGRREDDGGGPQETSGRAPEKGSPRPDGRGNGILRPDRAHGRRRLLQRVSGGIGPESRGRHEEGVPDRLDEPTPPRRAGQGDACSQNGAHAGKTSRESNCGS